MSDDRHNREDKDREELHELREKGHEAGIEGSSKMTEDQLREALRAREHGTSPDDARPRRKKTTLRSALVAPW